MNLFLWDRPTPREALEQLGDRVSELDRHSQNVLRDGGYRDRKLRFVPEMDTWTLERVLPLLDELRRLPQLDGIENEGT